MIKLENGEPCIRIGIVLPEDEKSGVSLVLPAGSTFVVSASGQSQTFTPEADLPGRLEVCSEAGSVHSLVLELAAEPPIRWYADTVTIAGQGQDGMFRIGGARLRQVAAGRSFHWKKEVDQVFSGTLHFYRAGAFILAVNELPVESYVAAVITAEMSGTCPLSFMKAQAITARTWCYANDHHKHGAMFSYCNDDCCQRYQGTEDLSEQAVKAVVETRGMILSNDSGELLNAQYTKCCGGVITMTSQFRRKSPATFLHAFLRKVKSVLSRLANRPRVKLDAPAGYDAAAPDPASEAELRKWIERDDWNSSAIFCSHKSLLGSGLSGYLGRVDEEGSYFRWNTELDFTALAAGLRDLGVVAGLKAVTALEPVERTGSGRITRLRIRYIDQYDRLRTHMIQGEYAIRRALSRSTLKSSAFVVNEAVCKDGQVSGFHLSGAGWGHGVGMCQMGALGMALEGYSYEEILNHYFENAQAGPVVWPD